MKFPRKQIKANARAALSANYWPLVGYPFLLGLLLTVVLSALSFKSILSLKDMATATSMYQIQEAALASTGATAVTDTITIIFSIFVLNVIAVGELYFYYKFYSGSSADFGTFFDGFKNGQYLHVVGGMFLMTLYVLLWTMLFALPGAILFSIGFVAYLMYGTGTAMMIIGFILYFAGIIVAFIKAYQYSMIPYLLLDKPEFTVKDCFNMTKKMTKGNKWSLFVLDLSFIGWVLLSTLTFFILFIFYVGPYMSLASAGAYDYLKRVHMPDSVDNGPVFQSADYEANYTGEPNNNDNMFEE